MASLVAQIVKHLATMQETWVQSLGREDPLEKEMAPHSSTLAWKIPWTEEPGRLQSTGSQRVGHDWATSLSFFLSLSDKTLLVPRWHWVVTETPTTNSFWKANSSPWLEKVIYRHTLSSRRGLHGVRPAELPSALRQSPAHWPCLFICVRKDNTTLPKVTCKGWTMHVKHRAQCRACGKTSINAGYLFVEWVKKNSLRKHTQKNIGL